MNRLSDADVRLAHQVDQALAEQPAPRAPAGLEALVFAAIEQRAARPWWRRSVREWPLPARTGFAIAGCMVVVALLLAPSGTLIPGPAIADAAAGTGLGSVLAHHIPLYHPVTGVMATSGHVITALANAIPEPLLHAGLVLGALAYLALFALLATIFRLPQVFSKESR